MASALDDRQYPPARLAKNAILVVDYSQDGGDADSRALGNVVNSGFLHGIPL